MIVDALADSQEGAREVGHGFVASEREPSAAEHLEVHRRPRAKGCVRFRAGHLSESLEHGSTSTHLLDDGIGVQYARIWYLGSSSWDSGLG